ncbi:MAG: hypothetical protein P4L50_10475 [Anaerolineaceae bacterium]|nr:hypothetical protein [Anaerolineaceae bacterium]
MKILKQLAVLAAILAGISHGSAQTSSDLNLSTRSVGVPPSHVTVDSVTRWMENPLDQKLQITVSNFCAAASDCMDLTIGVNHFKFYGAGQDELGQYIPTNYPPVVISAILRRDYPMSIMCPNSGPDHTPLFHIGDFNSTISDFLPLVTNSPTDPVSAFLWANFTSQAQINLTNADSSPDFQTTNLVDELNRILQGPCIYDVGRFSGITLGDTTRHC